VTDVSLGDVWPEPIRPHVMAPCGAGTAELQAALAFRSLPARSVLARRAGHALAAVLPSRAHQRLTGAVKVSRQLIRPRVARAPSEPWAALRPDRRPWNGRRAAVLLTHDLDTPDCVAALDGVLAAEAQRGLTSVVLVLTGAGYPTSREWFRSLEQRCGAVGLHGVTHDYAIGGRSSAQIRDHLRRGLAALDPVRPRFYRAPAFAVSARLAAELAALGVQCDSSRTVYHPGYPSARVLLPFHPPGVGSDLLELPVALEDAWLFREWRLDEHAAATYSDAVLALAIRTGGLVVVDTHPSILARFPAFYPALLDRWLANDDVWFATPDGLLETLGRPCAVSVGS
jgi:hypothetical protein